MYNPSLPTVADGTSVTKLLALALGILNIVGNVYIGYEVCQEQARKLTHIP